jgi:DNA-binding Lrp family transcriptional regulator
MGQRDRRWHDESQRETAVPVRVQAHAEESVMPVRAFVLIQTEVGRAAGVARAVADVAGVVSAEGVTGPYDVIARCEASGVDELGRMVVGAIQQIEGIIRTVTCPVVNLEGTSSTPEHLPTSD